MNFRGEGVAVRGSRDVILTSLFMILIYAAYDLRPAPLSLVGDNPRRTVPLLAMKDIAA